MLADYFPILVLFVIALGVAAFVILLSSQLGPRKFTARKLAPYESGMEPVGPAQRRFGVKFYVVAMLFIVFDIEVIFLFPYALVFREMGLYGLSVMGFFLIILIIGLVYEWKKGALQWE